MLLFHFLYLFFGKNIRLYQNICNKNIKSIITFIFKEEKKTKQTQYLNLPKYFHTFFFHLQGVNTECCLLLKREGSFRVSPPFLSLMLGTIMKQKRVLHSPVLVSTHCSNTLICLSVHPRMKGVYSIKCIQPEEEDAPCWDDFSGVHFWSNNRRKKENRREGGRDTHFW